MQSFATLSKLFENHFNKRHFPNSPSTLYDAAQYILKIGGKRVRPVSVLMGHELFNEFDEDALHVATAIELFHNFSLIHDDIMDKAPLRRGWETVHTKYGESTALLAGDVMLVAAYEEINKIKSNKLSEILTLYSRTAKEVCEGQQLDMDFEKQLNVSMEEYLEMITLKTSVLLAASLQLGAILGGAGESNQKYLYDFGKNIGIAFQIQDDYLDAFGDPEKFGKQVGGDILSNKKTFLLIHALSATNPTQRKELELLLEGNEPDKVARVVAIYKECKVDQWAHTLKEKYYEMALKNLHEIAVQDARKQELISLAKYLLQRDS